MTFHHPALHLGYKFMMTLTLLSESGLIMSSAGEDGWEKSFLKNVNHSLFLKFFDDTNLMAIVMMILKEGAICEVLFCGGDNNHHNRSKDLQ